VAVAGTLVAAKYAFSAMNAVILALPTAEEVIATPGWVRW
jgi:hypothetical protein